MTILLLIQRWNHPKCDDKLQMTSEDGVWGWLETRVTLALPLVYKLVPARLLECDSLCAYVDDPFYTSTML